MRRRCSDRRAGFTLIEALVALVVAGFLLPTLARAMSQAWTATRTPMEMVSALMLARDAASGGVDAAIDAGRRGYAVERSSEAADPVSLGSDVAPAPGGGVETSDGGPGQGLTPQATPGGMRLAPPKGLGGPPGAAAAAGLSLRHVSIVVATPSGRRVPYDAIRLDDAPR